MKTGNLSSAIELSKAKNVLPTDARHVGVHGLKSAISGRFRKGKTQRDRNNEQARKADDNRQANGRYTLACRETKYASVAIPSRDGIRNNGQRSRALLNA